MTKKRQQTPTTNVTGPSLSPLQADLANQGPEKRHLLQIIQQKQISNSFSGPLPPPEVLQAYNTVVPGLAERIVRQAETQTEHRIELENKVIGSDVAQSRYGLFLGFLLCLLFLVSGTLLVCLGHDSAGTIIATGAVCGLATAFIYGTASRKSERLRKASIMTGREDHAPPPDYATKPPQL